MPLSTGVTIPSAVLVQMSKRHPDGLDPLLEGEDDLTRAEQGEVDRPVVEQSRPRDPLARRRVLDLDAGLVEEAELGGGQRVVGVDAVRRRRADDDGLLLVVSDVQLIRTAVRPARGEHGGHRECGKRRSEPRRRCLQPRVHIRSLRSSCRSSPLSLFASTVASATGIPGSTSRLAGLAGRDAPTL